LTINLDIAGRKQAEEDATLLLGELDHRVKNILASQLQNCTSALNYRV
jgi:two-component sensor histidine kinase